MKRAVGVCSLFEASASLPAEQDEDDAAENEMEGQQWNGGWHGRPYGWHAGSHSGESQGNIGNSQTILGKRQKIPNTDT